MDADHPLIPNPREYAMVQNLVSIDSRDRDVLKYPNASNFAIELPQDYKNVISAKLSSWSFPALYDVFSPIQNNVRLFFALTSVYAGAARTAATIDALQQIEGRHLELEIDAGFYTPEQMCFTLTALMNEVVASRAELAEYDGFVVTYNDVTQRIWFGNSADGFALLNGIAELATQVDRIAQVCEQQCRVLPQEAEWGLPSNLGFTRCAVHSIAGAPRFHYRGPIDDAWLTPLAADAEAQCVVAPGKPNMMGPAYMYLEIDGLNCMDETSPYSITPFTVHTNQTNGVVNSAFAKIAIPATPVQQWFDAGASSYKFYTPPKECIRRLVFRFRYHNGRPVDFGAFPFSFTLEINTLSPSPQRGYNIRSPYDQGQIQSI